MTTKKRHIDTTPLSAVWARFDGKTHGPRVGFALLIAGALAGCSLAPDPITPAEHLQRAEEDYAQLSSNYLPVTGPLTLEEAIARALKYNYDAQLAKTEITLQERQLNLALSQMLPRVASDAGYTWRNNDNASSSISEQSKQESLEPSFSEEQKHNTADIQFSWNLLDLGVSYFQAKQQGYRAFIAVERRRKVIAGLVKDVQGAYWKTMAADKLIPRIDVALARAERVLDASRQAHQGDLQPPLVALDFQQSMLQVIGELKRMRNDLNSARIQLATLINAPASVSLATAVPETMLVPKRIDIDVKRLEQIGLALRPELREEAYQEKVSQQDVYKEMLKMLPGVSLLGDINYDSNRYLYNNVWSELGVRATLNLMNIIQGPQAIRAAESAVAVAKARRLALSVAVITQVNLGYEQYLNGLDNLKSATEIDNVQQQITAASTKANIAEAESDAERVRRSLTAMVAELNRYRALIDLHTNLAGLYSAVGIDIVSPTAQLDDLPTLIGEVKLAIADWQSGRLPRNELDSLVPPKPAAAPDGDAPKLEPEMTPSAGPALMPAPAPAPKPAALPPPAVTPLPGPLPPQSMAPSPVPDANTAAKPASAQTMERGNQSDPALVLTIPTRAKTTAVPESAER